MQYTVFYRLFIISIFVLMPFTNLQAAPLPENTVVEVSDAKQVFEQAKAYHDGQGVAQDLLQAYELYSHAAKLGNVDAKVNLGYMLFVGEGIEQDYYKSRSWYSQAAAAGDADAITTLSMMDRLKLGVATADKAEISASTLLAQQASVELNETQALDTKGTTDVSDYTQTQTELPDALEQRSNTTIIATQKTDPIKSEGAVFNTEFSRAVAPKRNTFSLPAYVLYLLAAGLCLGAGMIAIRFNLRRRKHLSRQRFKIDITSRNTVA